MGEEASFAARVRNRFPEGLTAMFAVGGTRTTYILENNRKRDNPGEIDNYSEYKDYLLDRYFEFIAMFVSLGGWNMIVTIFGYQSFHERGEAYTSFICNSTLDLINSKSCQFYEEYNVDPFFVGIDTLLQLPQDHLAHSLGTKLALFQRDWSYKEGRRKVIWAMKSMQPPT
jgi:hypothetical protein